MELLEKDIFCRAYRKCWLYFLQNTKKILLIYNKRTYFTTTEHWIVLQADIDMQLLVCVLKQQFATKRQLFIGQGDWSSMKGHVVYMIMIWEDIHLLPRNNLQWPWEDNDLIIISDERTVVYYHKEKQHWLMLQSEIWFDTMNLISHDKGFPTRTDCMTTWSTGQWFVFEQTVFYYKKTLTLLTEIRICFQTQ